MCKVWTGEQRVRLAFEKQLLKNELPDVWWEELTSRGATKVKYDYYSSGNNTYRICVCLRANYPYQMPDMYVISPKPLRGYRNKEITSYGTSHEMHVWDSDWNGYVKICHCKDEYWTASDLILGVFMKGFLWLEALEVNRRNGEVIDKYSLSY